MGNGSPGMDISRNIDLDTIIIFRDLSSSLDQIFYIIRII